MGLSKTELYHELTSSELCREFKEAEIADGLSEEAAEILVRDLFDIAYAAFEAKVSDADFEYIAYTTALRFCMK